MSKPRRMRETKVKIISIDMDHGGDWHATLTID